MRNVRILLPALLLLMLGGCRAKEIMVSKAVDISFKVDQVKATKIYFTVTSADPDATYMYFLLNKGMEGELPRLDDRALARYALEIAQESYNVKKEYKDTQSSLVNMSCFRGSRPLKETQLASDADYRLIVFQVDPVSYTLIGDVKGEDIHTPPIQMTDLLFSFQAEGTRLLITPSNPDCTYYWDYENAERIFDDYMSPYSYFYSVVDMYEDYGFMKNMLSQGPVEYDFANDPLKENDSYYVVAAAYDGEEINSSYTVAGFVFQDGSIHLSGQDYN